MTLGAIIEGLQILAKYEEEGLDRYLNGAEHDVIWATTADVDEEAEPARNKFDEPAYVDRRVSAEDAARLGELGWLISGENYDYSWTTFV